MGKREKLVAEYLLFMKRNSLYEKAGTGKVGQTIIEIQSEIASQGLSKGFPK